MRRLILAVITLLSIWFINSAKADGLSPKDILKSDQYLEGAELDMTEMSVDEMHLLADALSACTNSLSDNSIIQFECDSNQARYLIEYSEDRAIDKLLESVGIMRQFLRKSTDMRNNEVVQMILRQLEIDTRLSKSLNQAFLTYRLKK